MEVVFVSCEMSPLAQTGGLGDMVAALSQALKKLSVNSILILPKHRIIPASLIQKTDIVFNISIQSELMSIQVWTTKNDTGVLIYLLDIPRFFDRNSLYGEGGNEYLDNCARFVTFSQASIEFLKVLNLSCEIIHLHDWHTALIPFYLKTVYQNDPFFENTRTLLTIHNLAYQGQFEKKLYPLLEVDEKYFTPRLLEFYNHINFMKSGILSADAINTVSPSYALEILSPENGCGLEGVLKERKNDFYGILNGIDTEEWNPEHDVYLASPFSAKQIEGKGNCKIQIQNKMQLPEDKKIPIFASISRLVEQKGIDLILETIPHLLDQNAQWIFLGSGDPVLERKLLELAQQYPHKIAVQITFDPALAHQIEAGSDFFVMPSRFEPCGLNQMYSLRYGSIPIVHGVGGLKDTVVDLENNSQQGTGFIFYEFKMSALKEKLLQALDLYQNNFPLLNSVRLKGMNQDFSWNKSAQEYLKIYRKLLVSPKTLLPKL